MANTKIVEGQKPYTGGAGIDVDNVNKVISLLLRTEDNLLQVNDDDELYCDLQLANGIAPTDTFPVGVTTGIVNASDGWEQNGLLLHYETTSGAYAQWLYGADGKLYFDGGTGVFRQVYYGDDIGNALLTIQKNGTTVATFSANATSNVTANITVPTALSDLTNDLVNDGNLTIKRNHTTIAEFSANDATNVIADVAVPDVINNTTTIDSSNALSAAMGKELQDQINNLNAVGRFLSIWDCTTGLPQTSPTTLPYTYKTGDYYIIGTVSTATPPVNYKPTGSQYTGVASTTTETVSVSVGNMYVYDGTTWILQLSGGQSFPIDNVLSPTSTNAVENRVVTNALAGKIAKVTSPTTDNLASLTATGEVADAGIAKTAVELSANKETGSTLTDSTDKYPSSHTVLEAIGGIVSGVASVNGMTGIVTLDADDISDTGTTNQWTNATEKGTWNGKQDALTLPSTPTQGNLVTWGADNKTFADGGAIPNGVIVASTAPSPATEGMVWYDTTNDILKCYDGTNWNGVGAVVSVNGNTGVVTVSEFTPSGTPAVGDVVTKTANGYERATPSGGDVGISTQANNILTSGTKLWCGTQANYENLGTYDNNTIYLTI